MNVLPRRPVAGVATALVMAVLLVSGCSPAEPGSSPTPAPDASNLPGPSGGTALSPAELRLLLIDRLGPRWYCDPDAYPVQRAEQARAIEQFPAMQAENELLRAIAGRLGIDVDADVSDADKLAIYRLWKVAVSIPLDLAGDGRFRFDYVAQPAGGAAQGTRTAGIIDDTGTITIEQEAPADAPMCPICLAEGTPIDTPAGPVAVERLGLGDAVWTLDREGRRVVGTVIALGSAAAPAEHVVVRLTLQDGRSLAASPGHPVAGGRLVGDLRIGDELGGSRVVGSERIRYGGSQTYDIAVSGATGLYLAGGIPLGSTLD
jgi:Hint domain